MTCNTHTPFRDAVTILEGLNNGKWRTQDLVQDYLDKIDTQNSTWHAYVDVYADQALAQARSADTWRDSGLPIPSLLGLPISLKDMLEVEGCTTTCGSAAWKTRVSTQTSTVVKKLLAAGAIILGKTHMGEFAYGGWGINPHMGTPRNPWGPPDVHHAPGGSSSGAAVSVAAGLACAAIGSDTGGSVRVPAALNGLTGFKPTRHLIDTSGSLPMCTSLDSIGMITHSVADARLLFQAMCAREPSERTYGRPVTHPCFVEPPWRMRIAYLPADAYPCEVDESVHDALTSMIEVLQALGADVVPLPFPFDILDMMRSSDQIILSEAYNVHSGHIDRDDLPFGAWVADRIRRGKHISAHDYLQARAIRRDLSAHYHERLKGFDAYLLPVTPGPAPALKDIDEDRTTIGVFTRLVNYVGTCALSVPCDMSSDGLPVGLQLIGQPAKDWDLLTIGEQIQSKTTWHHRVPSI